MLLEGTFAVSISHESLPGIPQTFGGNLNPLRSDINGDGVVDIWDLVIVAKAFGSDSGDPGWKPETDLNGDGIVDLRDIAIVARDYGMRWDSAPLHADGTRLLDSSGKEVRLKGINVHLNERESSGGRYWTLNDVKRMKDAGADCIELHAELFCYWMPERNQINETYFVNWLDKQVSWCEQQGIFCIINLRGFSGNTDWARKEPFLPDWLWKDLGYAEPTSQKLADVIVRDFFDTNVEKQEINREAFINAWKFVASRYEYNRYALFGLVNEPLCSVEMDENTSSHLGITYSVLMTRVIDAIRSVGAQQLIFVDRPYVWYWYHIQPIDRTDIVWEDHSYVSPSSDINSWKSDIDDMIERFVYEFNKPLFIGEHGIDPYSVVKSEPWKTTWKSILEQQVAYLDGKPICGRQWHAYEFLYGEYMEAYFTEEDSQWILQTVLGG
jgi:hypothetical protein